VPIYSFVLAGLASFYAAYSGATTASGQRFDPASHTCAMLYEPFGERIEIVNTDNGKSSWCFVNDRGPFIPGRVIDVTPKVRDELGMGGLSNVLLYRIVGRVPRCKPHPQPQTCKPPTKAPFCLLDLPKPVLVKECK